MKFALLALALSAIATQAASYDKVDAVVPEELVEAPAPAPAPAAPTCSNDHLATDDHSGCQIFWYHAHVGCGGGHMSKEEAVAKVPGYTKCTTKAYKKCKRENRKDFDTCCHTRTLRAIIISHTSARQSYTSRCHSTSISACRVLIKFKTSTYCINEHLQLFCFGTPSTLYKGGGGEKTPDLSV